MDNINDNLTRALKTVQKMIGTTALRVCYIDLDAAAKLADFSTELGMKHTLVISDPATRAAAGEHVHQLYTTGTATAAGRIHHIRNLA
mgnify:CR=1 FL=1